MIPKIIHQVWIGDISLIHSDVADTKKFFENYGWKHTLWTKELLYKHDIISEEELEYIMKNNRKPKTTFGKLTDICRYRILKKFGGFYIDADTIILKDFDDLREKDFVCGYELDGGLIANNLIGSVPDFYLLDTLNEHIRCLPKKMLVDVNAWRITGPKLFTSIIKLTSDFDKSIFIAPQFYFCPTHHIDGIQDNSSELFKLATKDSYCWTYWGSTVKGDRTGMFKDSVTHLDRCKQMVVKKHE